MLAEPFTSITLPPIVSDLIEIDGSQTSDFKTLFNAITSESNDIILFQDGEDIFKWIYDKTFQSK
jgi:hypothetical protein